MGTIFRQTGRKNWMLKYYRDGRAIYESSGTTIKDDARTTLRSREGEIADDKPAVTKVARRLTFDDAAGDVVNDYTANQRRSIDDVQRRIDLHLKPYFGGKRMSAITTATVRAYVAERLEAKAKPATINRELAVLKRAFRLSSLTAIPRISLLAEHNVRTGFFEREQLAAVSRHLPAPLRPVMAVAFLTGWRVRSEILPMRWSQIDTKAQTMRLEVGTTKNSEGRTFPYGALSELADIIKAQDKVREAFKKRNVICSFVFPTEAGEQIDPFYSQAWRDACKRAGCPGKIPHDLRRTAVRNLVRAGVPEKTSMLLTGHKTRSIFDRYDIVDESDLKDAVTKLAAVPLPAQKRSGQR